MGIFSDSPLPTGPSLSWILLLRKELLDVLFLSGQKNRFFNSRVGKGIEPIKFTQIDSKRQMKSGHLGPLRDFAITVGIYLPTYETLKYLLSA